MTQRPPRRIITTILNTTQTSPPASAPAPKPGRKFARALRRAAEREISADQRAPVRDARGVVRQRATDQDRRAAVARYATRQQVARNRAQQARTEAADAVKAAEVAHDKAQWEVAQAEATDTYRPQVKWLERVARDRAKALRDTRAFAEAVASGEGLPPLPEVPPVPPAGKPAEIPYVGGAALVVNRYAHLPAGTTAARRREPTATGWLPARLR